MTFDQTLAERIREQIATEHGLTQKKMFGGLAFLIGGNMVISASGQGGILVRVDPQQSEKLSSTAGASVAVMRGRAMPGWLRVDADHVRTRAQVAKWVRVGTAYARTLPTKG
jgi:hypothetical protein